MYNLALQAVSLTGAQILLTYDDLTHSTRRKNFQNTVEKLLSIGVVPILNENDAVATEEIQFGDNDSLSAKIACTMNADKLVILTNVEGLYNANPNKNKKATLIAEISKLNNKIFDLAKGTSKMGTGGMLSKLTAAKEATEKEALIRIWFWAISHRCF